MGRQMSSVVVLPRAEKRGEARWGERGSWFPVTKSSGRRSAIIVCPGCGRAQSLDHEIAVDGTVTPSLQCAFDSCAFHEWVRLDGWEPGTPPEETK